MRKTTPFPKNCPMHPLNSFFAVYYLYAMKEQEDWRIDKNYQKLSINQKKNLRYNR